MARPQMKTTLGLVAIVGPVLIAAAIYFLAPLLLVIIGAADVARPGGFGRGLTSLMQVGVRSVFYAIVPALAATAFCTTASLLPVSIDGSRNSIAFGWWQRFSQIPYSSSLALRYC